ncbi:DUF2480 family protein [bacterium]|nr:DUF2480 family protein [bacterium]
MVEFNIELLVEEPVLREKKFRETLRNIDWEKFRDKKVVVRGCSQIEIPNWAFMLVTAYLVNYAEAVSYGEPCASIPVFKREKE